MISTFPKKIEWSPAEEAVVLSGVPVSQVQEDSVRDGGFKHRKPAQMACRSVPDAPPPPPPLHYGAGCWKGLTARPPLPPPS